MNPILLLTHNNLDLTRRCVSSAVSQSIETQVHIVDNGSTDGTVEWAQDKGILLGGFNTNLGVSRGWNAGLRTLFNFFQEERVLVVGNDTWLPPYTYAALISTGLPFVTGVAVGQMSQLPITPDIKPFTPNPDFSCFLISREVWEAVGPFDESMVHYSSDQDFHLRAHRKGIALMKACIPYYHETSSTIRLASPEEREELNMQANLDRAALRKKWGVPAGGPEYEALFNRTNFGVDRSN